MSEVRTTCPYCGVGCGLVAQRGPEGLALRGDAAHPANAGRLCGKGQALGDTLGLQERLLYPTLHGERVGWEAALDAVAAGLRDTAARHGPDAVGFYVSGQLLTEDYYVANKLMKGFIGSANIDTNSRLCMAAAVAGQTRAFGEDVVPVSYRDVEQAELVLIVGSNLAWCHPVVHQRLLQARAERGGGPEVWVIDPRRTATVEEADGHLALRPDSDAVLFNGLLVYLHAHGHLDARYIAAHTRDFEHALAAAREEAPDVAAVAAATGLGTDQVIDFYRRFARTRRTVTLYSQGINQSARGADRVNAIINCHLATGRLGRAGAGPFSITGQPNAMGGREVGGLATQLAGHRDFSPAARAEVQRLWRAPRVAERPGLKAVDLFEAVADGRVRALWIMGTNPLVSMPDTARVRRALRACPLVVVSEVSRRSEALRYAHVALPALAWGEKDGTVTNSERCISRQRAFLPAPGEARPDWWALARVGQRLGYHDAFPYTRPAQIFREHARLSGAPGRLFDIRPFARLSDADYEQLAPTRWPLSTGGAPFAQGQFPTADGRARFVPVATDAPARLPLHSTEVVLNTGRTRDHWHTLTRTALCARLSAHQLEPRMSVHPDDAARGRLAEGDLARLCGPAGSVVARVAVADAVPPGTVFLPMHWSAPWGNVGAVNAAVAAVVDPVSGQPALKHARVRLERVAARWHGFALATEPLVFPDGVYWAASRLRAGYRYELAGTAAEGAWEAFAQALVAPHTDQRWLSYRDAQGERWVCLERGRVRLVLCVDARWDVLPARAWLAQQLGAPVAPEAALRLLGAAAGDARWQGALVCACAGVHAGAIAQALQAGACDLAALAARTGAGGACGTCRGELVRLLRSHARAEEGAAALDAAAVAPV
ncbi:molybdopterin-dependent oxidoreductase [Ectothiorhodospiraceae bacterium 2226]|nr:molybdopterin-dependent oxidoreductase [Ectothiorhodospiraceae bacterium 2226]